MGLGIILIILPPFNFIWFGVFIFICLSVVKLGPKILKISSDEIKNANVLAVTLWGIDIAAMFGSLAVVYSISIAVPYFNGIHSEWGIAFENAYTQAVVYILLWVGIYAAFLLPSYFIFKKNVFNKKRISMFYSFIIISAVVWAILMLIVFLK